MSDIKQTIRRQFRKARGALAGEPAKPPPSSTPADPMAVEAAQLEKNGDFAGAMALVQRQLDRLGDGKAQPDQARKLRHTVARLASLDGRWPAATGMYLGLLAEDPADARAARGLEVAALRGAREAQSAERWREACDMWLALAKVGTDRVKIVRNILSCAYDGAKQAEKQNDREAALAFWRDCLGVDPGCEDALEGIERIVPDLARAASLGGSADAAREYWTIYLRYFPSDVRAKMGLLRAGGTLEGSSPVDAILRRTDEEPATKAAFFFDVSDIVIYFRGARTPTGIQRISFALIEAALSGEGSEDVALCAIHEMANEWRTVNAEMFRLLLLLSREGSDEKERAWVSAQEEFDALFAQSPKLTFPDNSIVVSLGSPWGVANYFLHIREAKRRSNIFYTAFVHDTIPLLYPQYCHGDTVAAYTNWIASIGGHADLMFANAENTKRDFLSAIQKFGGDGVRCEVVHPNGDFSSHAEGAVSEDVQALAGSQYALFVGTIEPRKDHLLVLAAWRRLIEELGPDNVPTLVCAGRMGWHCEKVTAFVAETSNLGGKLVMLNGASDVDLRTLYRNAQFTIYNSHYEGWGLPVTESLSYGKVPVVARNSGLIESGGEHAIFYETSSEPSLLAALHDVIARPGALREKQSRILTQPPIRPWRDVLTELRGKVAAAAATRGKEIPRARIDVGRVYPLRSRSIARSPSRVAIAELMRTGAEWHSVEGWGTWTAANRAELEFDVADLRASGDLSLLLAMRGPPETGRLNIALNGKEIAAFAVPVDGDFVARIPVDAALFGDGRVRLTLQQDTLTDLTTRSKGRDKRLIGVGVRSVMLCRADDLEARIVFLEEEASFLVVDAPPRV